MSAASNFLGKMLFQGNVYNKNVLLVSQQYYFSSDSIVRIISTLINTHLPTQIGTYVVDKNRHACLLTLIKHKGSSGFLMEFNKKRSNILLQKQELILRL